MHLHFVMLQPQDVIVYPTERGVCQFLVIAAPTFPAVDAYGKILIIEGV